MTIAMSGNFALAEVAGFGEDCDGTNIKCSEGFICKNKICKFKFDAIDCNNAENSAETLICRMLGTLGIVFAICLVLAVLYFVLGMTKYITAGGDEEKIAQGKRMALYGIIALVIIAGLAGIMGIVINYFNIHDAIPLPFMGGY